MRVREGRNRTRDLAAEMSRFYSAQKELHACDHGRKGGIDISSEAAIGISAVCRNEIAFHSVRVRSYRAIKKEKTRPLLVRQRGRLFSRPEQGLHLTKLARQARKAGDDDVLHIIGIKVRIEREVRSRRRCARLASGRLKAPPSPVDQVEPFCRTKAYAGFVQEPAQAQQFASGWQRQLQRRQVSSEFHRGLAEPASERSSR